MTSSQSNSVKGILHGYKDILGSVFSSSSPPDGKLGPPSTATSTATPADDDATARAKLDSTALWRLAQLIQPEAKPLGVAMGTLGVTTAISLAFPAAIGQVLDVSLGSSSGLAPTTIAGGLFVLFTLQTGLIIVRQATLSVVGERVAARVRRRLFSRMLDQDLAFFDRHRTGDLINRLSADTAVVQSALTNNVTDGLRSVFTAVGATGLMLYMAPKLALLSLAIIPPVGVVGRRYGSFMKTQQRQVQDALGGVMQTAEEVVGNVRTVRAFAREDTEKLRFAHGVEDVFQQARRVSIAGAFFTGTVHMATNMCLLAVLGYGGSLVLDGSMTAGQLTSFLMYSVYVGFNVATVSTVYGNLMKAAGASARIDAVADRTPALPVSGGREPAVVEGGVQFRDVVFSYPERPDAAVLQGLSLDVAPGQMVSVVGPSGSGKSTLSSLLMRLYDVEGGSVSIDGVDVRDVNPQWLRSVVGTVSQEPVLFATTIRDNILYGRPDATPEDVEAAAAAANVASFVAAFPDGLDTVVGERGVQLSGGQKQRVAIARVLLKDPAVVVLDEATSALDGEQEHAVQEALNRAVRGRTVINIAHRLSSVKMADTIAVLGGGKVVESGPFDDLRARPDGAFAKLMSRQVGGGADQ